MDLRSNNEEELGKERLQAVLFAGTPYAHPALGTVAGIDAITLEDVKAFVARAYTRGNADGGRLRRRAEGLRGPAAGRLAALPDGAALRAAGGGRGAEAARAWRWTSSRRRPAPPRSPSAIPSRSPASHPDFAALSVARTWLGEHRSSSAHLYQRIREIRGMNYGDYAYIEAFPRGMFQFFPNPNIARRAQVFEVWIRPVAPENAHMALRIAVHELDKLVRDGLSEADFQATRNYLMKNVYLQTATQDQRLGYALDSEWYGIGEYTSYMRERLARLTREDVNRAVRKHLSATDLAVVIITKDAEGLKQALVAEGVSPIKYDAEKPAELLAEDKVIGARKLGIRADALRVTPVDEVFRAPGR